MKRTPMLMMLTAFTLLLPTIAGAAGDPWIGTWQRHGKNGAPDITLEITPHAGGYTFVKKESDAPIVITMLVIPDDHSHSVAGGMGPMASTCHRADARTIRCTLSMAGMDSDANFALSADGKDLTDSETDSEPAGQPAPNRYTDTLVLHKE